MLDELGELKTETDFFAISFNSHELTVQSLVELFPFIPIDFSGLSSGETLFRITPLICETGRSNKQIVMLKNLLGKAEKRCVISLLLCFVI